MLWCFFQVRESDITAEVVEELKSAGPKIAVIIEANGEGDAAMLDTVFKVWQGNEVTVVFRSFVVVCTKHAGRATWELLLFLGYVVFCLPFCFYCK